MKKSTVLIGITILATGLGATLAYLRTNSAEAGALPARPAPASAPDTAQRPAPDGGSIPRFFTNGTGVDWRQLESEDYRNYIANLRAIGCPEQTIRDIIVADVNKTYEQREKQLAGSGRKYEFWKARPTGALDEDKLRQRIELAREKRGVLKELLGMAVDDQATISPQSLAQEQRLGFLPKERQQEVSEFEATTSAKINALFVGKARPSREDLARMRELEAEGRAELAKALTPQELEDYELRNSRTAQFMRGTLGNFEMTEEEFRAVFKLRKGFDEAFSQTMVSDEPQTLAARLQVDQQIRSVMGDERYTQYAREQGWATSSLRNVADEYGIPKDTAVRVFDLKPAAQEQATRIWFDQTLSEEQKRQALRAVQEETVKTIGGLIGADAAQAYFRQGAWLRNLSMEEMSRFQQAGQPRPVH